MLNPRLIFILPCQGLDDFPTSLSSAESENLLASWTALWHPRCLLHSGALPEWKRPDSASLDVENAVLICPAASQPKLDLPIRERFSLNNCLFVTTSGNRANCLSSISQALPEWSLDIPLDPKSQVDIQDFFALGFAYLQIQLLTKRLRYSSNLNEPLLNEQAISAAKAALANQPEEAERWLQSCFDQLSQERDHYYSQSAHLLEVVLLAPTTLGDKLANQVETDRPHSYLATAQLLKKIRDQAPNTFARLAAGIQDSRIATIGGLDQEAPIHLLNNLGLRRSLRNGRQAFEKLGIKSPAVYGRFGIGITAEFPLHLKQSAFTGAILCDWQGGTYPNGNQAKITWEAADGSGLDSVANHFLDASNPSSFLNLGGLLAAQLDHHQVPTLTFAHWPGKTCTPFDDLVRTTKRTPALGVWSQVEDYFASTQRPYHQERIPANRFPAPIDFGRQSHLESIHQYWSLAGSFDSILSLSVLRDQIESWLDARKAVPRNDASESIPSSDTEHRTSQPETPQTESPHPEAIEAQWAELAQEIDGWIVEGNRESPTSQERIRSQERASQFARLQARLKELRSKEADRWSSCLSKNRRSSKEDAASGKPGAETTNAGSRIVLNPFSQVRRVFLRQVSGQFLPSPESRVYAVDTNSDASSDVVLDLPPMGYVALQGQPSTPSARGRKRSKGILSAEGVLGNEFIEAHVDPKSGRLHALYIALKRGNRLSGQLTIAVPGPTPASPKTYASAIVRQANVVTSHSVRGQYAIVGELQFSGRTIGTFELEYSLWRGSRLLEISCRGELRADFLQLHPDAQWVWRTAWPNEAAVLSHWNQGTRQPSNTRSFHSPLLVEIDEAEHKVYLLSGGCSVHRKIENRFLDTCIDRDTMARGEARLAVGMDLPRPYQSALEWLDPVIDHEIEEGSLLGGPTAWFVQSHAPNVLVHLIDSLVDSKNRRIGVRVLLHETSGTSTATKVEFFRAVRQADRVDCTGRSLGSVTAEGDAIRIHLRQNEQTFVDILWSDRIG